MIRKLNKFQVRNEGYYLYALTKRGSVKKLRVISMRTNNHYGAVDKPDLCFHYSKSLCVEGEEYPYKFKNLMDEYGYYDHNEPRVKFTGEREREEWRVHRNGHFVWSKEDDIDKAKKVFKEYYKEQVRLALLDLNKKSDILAKLDKES